LCGGGSGTSGSSGSIEVRMDGSPAAPQGASPDAVASVGAAGGAWVAVPWTGGAVGGNVTEPVAASGGISGPSAGGTGGVAGSAVVGLVGIGGAGGTGGVAGSAVAGLVGTGGATVLASGVETAGTIDTSSSTSTGTVQGTATSTGTVQGTGTSTGDNTHTGNGGGCQLGQGGGGSGLGVLIGLAFLVVRRRRSQRGG
jgi:MYXO-CTERM domain-containing protein